MMGTEFTLSPSEIVENIQAFLKGTLVRVIKAAQGLWPATKELMPDGYYGGDSHGKSPPGRNG